MLEFKAWFPPKPGLFFFPGRATVVPIYFVAASLEMLMYSHIHSAFSFSDAAYLGILVRPRASQVAGITILAQSLSFRARVAGLRGLRGLPSSRTRLALVLAQLDTNVGMLPNSFLSNACLLTNRAGAQADSHAGRSTTTSSSVRHSSQACCGSGSRACLPFSC